MISDRFILSGKTNEQAVMLDVAEHMAACYGFSGKELLMVRLLTEEMLSSLHSALLLNPGELWFDSKDGVFSITASCSTDVSGMSKEQRKKLLNLSRSGKKAGLFGLVKEFMDFLLISDESTDFDNYMGTYYGSYVNPMFHTSFPRGYAWGLSMQDASWYKPDNEAVKELEEWKRQRERQLDEERQQEGKQEDKQEDEVGQDLELSILQSYTDDIQVKGKAGTLEMTVMKKIPSSFVSNFREGKVRIVKLA